MITTNKNNNFLLELEKHILKVLDQYSKSGDQFLNFPEKGVFSPDKIRIGVGNRSSKIVFCIVNNKFYCVSSGDLLPIDQFVTLYDSSLDFRKEMTDIVVNAEEFARILVNRIANYNFNTFYYDKIYGFFYEYMIKGETSKREARDFFYRFHELSDKDSDYKHSLQNFVYNLLFKGSDSLVVKHLKSKPYSQTLNKNSNSDFSEILSDFVTDEDKLLEFLQSLGRSTFGDWIFEYLEKEWNSLFDFDKEKFKKLLADNNIG